MEGAISENGYNFKELSYSRNKISDQGFKPSKNICRKIGQIFQLIYSHTKQQKWHVIEA